MNLIWNYPAAAAQVKVKGDVITVPVPVEQLHRAFMHPGDIARYAQSAGEGERGHKQEAPAVTRHTYVAHTDIVNVELHLSDDRADSVPQLLF